MDVVARHEDDTVVVEVIDQGMGISAEELPLLFIKFHRTTRAMEAGIQGTGLGLALVKESVDAHGGSVRVTSEEGVGSRFTVVLPIGELPGAKHEFQGDEGTIDLAEPATMAVAESAGPVAVQ